MNNLKGPNKTILQTLGILLILIMGAAFLSRLLSGETLAEYAQQNPDIAYASQDGSAADAASDPEDSSARGLSNASDQPSSTDTSVEQDMEISSESSQDVGASALSDDESISTPSGNDSSLNRTTLREDFYSENLSASLIDKITGVSYPDPYEVPEPVVTYDDLRYLHVLYVDFDGETKEGELICNASIAEDLLEIFAALYDAGYQIDKMVLIDAYGGDDDLSCADDNTSCFNYRVVAGSDHLSRHAYGLAVDINPFYNPYITYNKDGSRNITPEGAEAYADREADFPYKITSDDLCCRLFLEHGFTWGGNWNSVKDYQHFEKKP